jgi:predicted GNAT family N-acyltransferase
MTAGSSSSAQLAVWPLEVRIARTRDEFAKIVAVRARVFRDEQEIVEHALTDNDDPQSVHAFAKLGRDVIAVGRLTPPTKTRAEGQIAWVATLPEYRGHGAGTAVMEALLAIADEHRFPSVLISAQTHALPFYRRLGFDPYGDRFVVRAIEHQYMERRPPA